MASRSFSDQTGYTVYLDSPPQRIISLVPSQTELLADLGLNERTIGITKFCIHPPEWRTTKAIVGGTKNFHFDTIDSLKPDLIIGNKEENYKEGIEILREKYPVWLSDIVTLNDALSMIQSIGRLTEKETEAAQCVQDVAIKFSQVKKFEGQSVLYLIWRLPWMAVGKDTFIDAILTSIGLRNAIRFTPRYPEITAHEITAMAPDCIFLSSEPYPFRQNHISEIQQYSPASKIVLVDGEMFSWYGSRLRNAPDYFNTLELA